MSVDPAALIAGGLLTARGGLAAGLSAAEVRDQLDGEVGVCTPSTLWVTSPLGAPGEVDAYLAGARQPAASWEVPDAEVVAAAEQVLADGWRAVADARLVGRTLFDEPVLRLIVRSVDDALTLQRLGTVGPYHVTAHIGRMLGAWRWRWPLRVGVAASPDAARLVNEANGQGQFADQYSVRIVEAGEPAELDLLVVDENVAERPSSRAGVIVVVGPQIALGDPRALAARLDRGRSIESGAIIAMPDHVLGWFEHVVRQLSHDRPLDAAIGLIRPDAVIMGDPRFLAITALRNWNLQVDQQLRDRLQIVPPFADIVRTVPFDSESQGGHVTAGQVSAVEAANNTTVEIRGDAPRMRAVPPAAEPPAAERPAAPFPQALSPAEIIERHRPARPVTPRAARPQSTDARSLHAAVATRDGNVRTDGFIGGVRSTLKVCIAREVVEPAVRADARFSNPARGVAIDLDVLIQPGWPRGKPARRKLHLPAVKDSEWTEPVVMTVPRRLEQAQVFITVMWQGRAVQSAVLSGPVMSRRDPQGPEAMKLTVDVSMPESVPSDAADARPAADASFVIIPLKGKPQLFDAGRGVPIASDDLERANRNVSKDLVEAFQNPPTDLASAAHPLAKLATRGSLLRDNLRGRDKSFYDDATWVHVTSYGGDRVPFELIYEHPLPDSFDVPVCPTALAGAQECATNCPDRQRSDCVCPFGFWATTKVVERRLHTAERRQTIVSSQRKVAVRKGSAVAVTPKANADDPSAADRIGTAVTGFSDPGTCVITTTWDSLEQAVTQARNLVVLVTHTIEPDDPDDDLSTQLELGAEAKFVRNIDKRYFNPTPNEPGPIVLALGCDTNEVQASYASLVQRLHSFGVEIVVSAISQIPGKEVADFVQRLVDVLTVLLADGTNEPKRFGAVMTAARRATLLRGDVLALALTASGDGDVQLTGG